MLSIGIKCLRKWLCKGSHGNHMRPHFMPLVPPPRGVYHITSNMPREKESENLNLMTRNMLGRNGYPGGEVFISLVFPIARH